ncbi:MAG: RimJ/RimL family protein N-acetyltransferase [Bacteroidetes bacterium]|nr:MAG: RimJ/RimL family protein N-acetyltransferase [Bacteroidota bacterium]
MSILTTKRLILENATLEDADFIFRLLNSPNWIEFIGDKGIETMEDAIAYIKNSLLNSYETNGYGLLKACLKENNAPIGICGFIKRDYLDFADIGFAILPKYEGKGYTSEAAIATMQYGRSELNFSTILALTKENNHRSRNLLSTIGLVEIDKITPIGSNEELLLFSS